MRAIRKFSQRRSAWSVTLQQVSGATIALAVTGLLGRGISLLTHMVIASEFGLSVASDAFFAAENVPELCIDFLAFSLCTVFIPMYADYKARSGDEKARQLADSFHIFSAAVSAVLSVVVFAAAPVIVRILFPGFHDVASETTTRLFRIMALCIFLFGAGGSLRGLLHTHKDFITPEMATIGYGITLLIFAAALSGVVGVEALAWGVVAGAAINFVILLAGSIRRKIFHPPRQFEWATGLHVARMLVLFFLALAGIKITFMLDRMVASTLPEGSLTALNYAARIALLPVGIFAIPLRTTIYPDLSEQAALNNHAQMGMSIVSGLKVLLYIVVPIGACVVALNTPMIRLLFERGAFDVKATLLTGEALIFYAFGIPATAMVFVLNSAYLSLGKAAALIKINLVGWVINLVLNIALRRTMAHCGVALATSISVTVSAGLMLYYLRRTQFSSLDILGLAKSALRILLLSAVVGCLLAYLYHAASQMMPAPGLLPQLILLACLLAVGSVVYLAAGYVLKLEELATLTSAIRKLLRRGAR